MENHRLRFRDYSEWQIPLVAAADAVQAVEELAFAIAFGKFGNFALDHGLTSSPGFGRGVIDQIFQAAWSGRWACRDFE